MMKKWFILIGICGLFTILLVACGSSSSAATSSTGDPVVHMNTTNFTQSSITIKKGQSVTLVDDDLVTPHIISNGTWDGGSAKPGREPGAPAVTNMQISGNSSGTIGPFTTAGTYQLYCTIHPGMNLTIIVQ
jgi:plastocyanin